MSIFGILLSGIMVGVMHATGFIGLREGAMGAAYGTECMLEWRCENLMIYQCLLCLTSWSLNTMDLRDFGSMPPCSHVASFILAKMLIPESLQLDDRSAKEWTWRVSRRRANLLRHSPTCANSIYDSNMTA